jgi:NAD(P) transhydrogenase subunit beta
MSPSLVANLTAFAYLVAGVCFILALRGLSSPVSSRRGNFFGMAGMAIAIITTVAHPEIVSYGWIIVALAIGGTTGVIIALKIQMTAMPQLVAAFHSLVGLAAVLVAGSAFSHPQAYGIATPAGIIFTESRIEMGLGVVIGAITFSGSVVAFTKLQGLVSGAPVTFPGQHMLNAAIGLVIIGLIGYFCTNQDPAIFWTMTGLAFAIGFLLIIPIGGADMPVVISMLNS